VHRHETKDTTAGAPTIWGAVKRDLKNKSDVDKTKQGKVKY